MGHTCRVNYVVRHRVSHGLGQVLCTPNVMKTTLQWSKCFNRKYTTCKIRAKLHPGPDWYIFHILTSEDIDDVISQFSRLFVQTVSFSLKRKEIYLLAGTYELYCLGLVLRTVFYSLAMLVRKILFEHSRKQHFYFPVWYPWCSDVSDHMQTGIRKNAQRFLSWSQRSLQRT